MSLSLNDPQRFRQCVKLSFISILSNVSPNILLYISPIVLITYNILFVLAPDLQLYNISSDEDQLTHYEEVLDSLLQEFQSV